MAAVETIVAISTPLGEGGVGLVRLSGPCAFAIGQEVFSSKTPLGHRLRYVEYGTILDDRREPLDHGLAWAFQGPRSYTGEDTVEISCHGSTLVLESLVQAAITKGARLAEPGEFTRRAFLNGRLDLLQSEAVIDLIQAGSKVGMHNAYGQASGNLSTLVQKLKAHIITALALIEVGLDFSEEDIRTIGHPEVSQEFDQSISLTRRLVDTFEGTRRRQNGFQIALIGSPNAGKSTLLNSLLGEDRAIVTAVPGTTRDTVEGRTVWEGESVRLIDTAGLRQSSDPIEEQGIERSLTTSRGADLVVFVLDHSKAWSEEEDFLFSKSNVQPDIIVFNKVDLPELMRVPPSLVGDCPIIQVSALKGKGLEQLPPLAMDLVSRPNLVDGVGLTRARHHEALQSVLQHLENSRDMLLANDHEECIAAELHGALFVLGELLGETVSDDVLDRIFSQFCIGK